MSSLCALGQSLPLEMREHIVSMLPRKLRVAIGCNISESSFWYKSLGFSREQLTHLCVRCYGITPYQHIRTLLTNYSIVCIENMSTFHQILVQLPIRETIKCKYLYLSNCGSDCYAMFWNEIHNWPYRIMDTFEKIVIVTKDVSAFFRIFTYRPNAHVPSLTLLVFSRDRCKNQITKHTQCYRTDDFFIITNHNCRESADRYSFSLKQCKSIDDVLRDFASLYRVFFIMFTHEVPSIRISIDPLMCVKRISSFDDCIDDAVFRKFTNTCNDTDHLYVMK